MNKSSQEVYLPADPIIKALRQMLSDNWQIGC